MCTNFKMSNLSLLSRGTGQMVRKNQEKLEVHFDPEDYLNWKCLETDCHASRQPDNNQDVEGYCERCLPKTYSTRTGALVLYSEDLAKPSKKLKGCRKAQRRPRSKSQTLHIEFHTLQDLARAILAYGGKQLWKNKKGVTGQPYLHFLSKPDIRNDRQMRPGYSAKRYLLKLSQTWDPSILRKLQCAGCIRDPLLLEENSPDHRRKQDLSAVPPKYNLLHIFCSPCPYFQNELEEQQTQPGLGSSSQKQFEDKTRLGEGYEEGRNARIRARIPLRVSVRKLSFHLGPQHTKESTWNQHPAYRAITEDRWVGLHQDGETTNKDPDHNEVPKQSVDYPVLGNTSIDTSELWCEKSHVTFYGGFFPGRKNTYSVNQKCLKSAYGRERGPSADTGLLPPIQSGTSSEQGGVMEEYRKQMPEIFKLPQISENSPRGHRKELKYSEFSKELVALPLLVQLEREHQAKMTKPQGTSCSKPQSEADVCNKQLAPLLNDLILEPEHGNEQQQERIHSEIPEASQAYQKSTLPRSLMMGPDREILCPSPLGSVQTTDDPRLRHSGFIPDEEGNGELSLDMMITVSTSLPETSSEVPELDGKEGIQVFTTLKNGSCALYADKRLEQLTMQQAGKLQGNQNDLEKEQGTKGNESIAAGFRKGDQKSQDGLCRNNHLLQKKEEKGHSSLPRTQISKRKDGDDFIQEMENQLDNLPQSASLSHMEPYLAHSVIPASKMERVPESDSAIMELLDHREEIKESSRMGMHSSEKQSGLQEGGGGGGGGRKTMMPEKNSKPSKATNLNMAGNILEDKVMTRRKKPVLVGTGAVAKVQKKSRKKEEHQSRTEFVVGKPRWKKALGKTVTYSKDKPADVRRSETPEEPNQDEEKADANGEVEQIRSLVEEGGGREEEMGSTADQSPPPSSPLMEEHPLPLEEDQPSAKEFLHPSRPHPDLANEMATVSHPIVSTANGPQLDAVQSSELPEDPPQNEEEERRSWEQIIAERAEKRRLAVERRRREQEEQKRKEQEQQERMERMKEGMEEEQRKRREEMSLRKQQLEEERQRQEAEATRQWEAERAAQERARRQLEEHRRKLLEMQKKKQEEEQERSEVEKHRQKERAMWLEEERRCLGEMAEEQRLEYETRKWEEEERARREAEERRKRAEEEARIALEEARKLALSLARQRAALEKEQQFQYKLFVEARGLERGQEISRPWVYSYFQHAFLKVGDED